MNKKFESRFTNFELNTMMSIATPLINHLIPNSIISFDTMRNKYIMDNFYEIFVKEYHFHPHFINKHNCIEIEVLNDSMSFNTLQLVSTSFEKIRTLLKEFKVVVNLEINIFM